MEVLLVAAKKEAVELHKGLLAGAGVRPGAIELEQFALQRAYEFSYKPSGDECVTILNIGAEVTNMVVVKGGLPSFNRDLSIGGSRFIEALQRSMGLDYETSEKVLRGELPEGVSPDEVKSALSYVIEELSTSVRRSFISFQASGESTRIDRMYVSGGCSLVPGLATTLSEQHGLPVEALQPFQNLVVDSSVIPEDDRPAIGALLAVCIGLAIRGFEPGRVDINVMESGEVKKKKAAAGGGVAAPSGSPVAAILGALPIILIAAGIVLMGLHYMNLKKQEKSLQGQIVQMDADIAEMQSQVSLQQEAANLASQLAAKQADVQSLALNQRYAVYVMEYLCRALYPEQTALAEEADKGIYLTAMVLSDSTMHITGIARTWGDIVSFQRRLAELKPDGQNTLFQLASYGQTYSLTMITPTGNMPAGVGTGVAAAAETRYQFDLEVSVNRASLAPLVGDYSGI